jgi:manganese peroxidase
MMLLRGPSLWPRDFGGADGSLILFREDARLENNSLQDIVTKMLAVKAKHGVGAADLVQFAAQHATVTCPQGPRIAFFAGRINATQPAPPGLVPDVHASVENLVSLL